MPCIRNQETIDIIAENYATNGQNKTKALVDAGYKAGYADSGRSHKFVFGNERVKQAISKKIAEVKAVNIKNREERQQFWTRMMDSETATNSDKLRASELLGKSEADFTDNVNQALKQPAPLTEAEIKELKRLAGLATNISIHRPESPQEAAG